MKAIKKATLIMSSGQRVHFDEEATKDFLKLLNPDAELQNVKPIVINNKYKVTTNIIYPEHITEIVFE